MDSFYTVTAPVSCAYNSVLPLTGVGLIKLIFASYNDVLIPVFRLIIDVLLSIYDESRALCEVL
jgi:hypothetical protein